MESATAARPPGAPVGGGAQLVSRIPFDLWRIILGHLSGRDALAFRLSCRAFWSIFWRTRRADIFHGDGLQPFLSTLRSPFAEAVASIGLREPVRHHTTLDRLVDLPNLAHVTVRLPGAGVFVALSRLTQLRSIDVRQMSADALLQLRRLTDLSRLSHLSLDLCHVSKKSSLPHLTLLGALPLRALSLSRPSGKLWHWLLASPLANRLQSLSLSDYFWPERSQLLDLRPLTALQSLIMKCSPAIRGCLPVSLTHLCFHSMDTSWIGDLPTTLRSLSCPAECLPSDLSPLSGLTSLELATRMRLSQWPALSALASLRHFCCSVTSDDGEPLREVCAHLGRAPLVSAFFYPALPDPAAVALLGRFTSLRVLRLPRCLDAGRLVLQHLQEAGPALCLNLRSLTLDDTQFSKNPAELRRLTCLVSLAALRLPAPTESTESFVDSLACLTTLETLHLSAGRERPDWRLQRRPEALASWRRAADSLRRLRLLVLPPAGPVCVALLRGMFRGCIVATDNGEPENS